MARNALKILFLGNSIFVLAGNLLGPLYASYASTITNNLIYISASWAAFLLSTTIFTTIIAKVGDNIIEKEFLIIAGYLVRAIAWLSFIFVNSFPALVAAQVIIGLGDALGSPGFDAVLAKHVHRHKSIREYSSWKIVSNVALALGTLMGGAIANSFGFTPLFLIMSFLALLAAGTIWVQPRKLL